MKNTMYCHLSVASGADVLHAFVAADCVRDAVAKVKADDPIWNRMDVYMHSIKYGYFEQEHHCRPSTKRPTFWCEKAAA